MVRDWADTRKAIRLLVLKRLRVLNMIDELTGDAGENWLFGNAGDDELDGGGRR